MKEFNRSFFNFEFMSEIDAYNLNPLSLAFVGDAVYTLFIRQNITLNSNAKSGQLHKAATAEVKATAQATRLKDILESLNEREAALVKRARNTKVNTSAKHATLAEYMYATAYEALIGYLYLTGQSERLEQILII